MLDGAGRLDGCAISQAARDTLLVDDLYFHDSRGEALTRLAHESTLSRISGIEDITC